MKKARETIGYCGRKWRKRTLVATPTEGMVRYEWAHARFGQVMPMNWEFSGYDLAYTAIGFSIDDAYNNIVKRAIDQGVEWLITVEDDVILPKDAFLKFEKYQRQGDIPIVSGLYYLKANPTKPMIFRDRGNGVFTNWKIGQKVWCDGLPMGCLMIHMSILKWMWDHTEDYVACNGETMRRVFESPARMFYDPECNAMGALTGTQDLYFFDQILKHNVLKKTGWDKVARRKWPFLCDTSIFCNHIDRNSGRIYP